MDVFTGILQEYVDSGAGVGASARITHRGKEIYRGAAGFADIQAGTPFTCENIVRIFSLTKMITAVAALKLYEQGLFMLDDPVSKFVPAFQEATVLDYSSGDTPTIRKPKVPLTMRHLFTMTAGYAYPAMAAAPNTPRRLLDGSAHTGKVFQQCMEERSKGIPLTTKRMLDAIATIPMCFEPGESFLYGLSADILGGVVETISGKTLGQFMQDEIFRPLGMENTGFNLTPQQKARLATVYDYSDPSHVVPYDFTKGPVTSIIREDPTSLEICIGGVFSTLDDYSRFMQMLCNGGTLDQARILGRKTVELMTMDHLTDQQHAAFQAAWYPRSDASWGLMTRVTTSLKNSPHAFFPGTFGWSGAAGTIAVADPKEGLTITMMTQRLPSNSYALMTKLTQAAYAAID